MEEDLKLAIETINLGAVVAQSVGTWLGNWRVAGSSPAWTTQYGVWAGSWRGASSPPGHCP